MFVLFCFVCDHSLTLLNCRAPHCAFGIIGKLLAVQCAWWLFHNFSTNQCLFITWTLEFTIVSSPLWEMHKESPINDHIGHPIA